MKTNVSVEKIIPDPRGRWDGAGGSEAGYLVGAEQGDQIGLHLWPSLFRDAVVGGGRLDTRGTLETL